jgi:hypothetical protein
MRNTLCLLALISSGVILGCEAQKSSNPLSPSVAGPIAGVSITAPTVVSPTPGSRVAAQEPVVLTVRNATTTGVRPLSYMFEVAADNQFAQKLYARTGIPPGDGQTSHRMTDSLTPDRTYYWRARAEDGANTGAFTDPVALTVYTPVVIGPPAPLEPVNGVTVTSARPVFVVGNATRTGPAGAVTYLLNVALDAAFTQRVLLLSFAEQSSQTRMTPDQDLPPGKQLFWRVRASDPQTEGPWSATQVFVTAATPAPTPGPGPSPGPGPAPNDAIDLRSVTIVKGENITNWAVTSTLTNVSVGNGQICTGHTMAGRWPPQIWFDQAGVYVEGNQWIFANINGKWYGGAGEWLRPGQTCKPVDKPGPDVFYDAPPLRDWTPRSGELVGVAVSTPARAGQWGIAERSNIVLIRWP